MDLLADRTLWEKSSSKLKELVEAWHGTLALPDEDEAEPSSKSRLEKMKDGALDALNKMALKKLVDLDEKRGEKQEQMDFWMKERWARFGGKSPVRPRMVSTPELPNQAYATDI